MSPQLKAIAEAKSFEEQERLLREWNEKTDRLLRDWDAKRARELLVRAYVNRKPYVLSAFEWGGSFEVARFATCAELVAHVKAKGLPKGCQVRAYNDDRHDCDGYGTESQSYDDGLTEDERDAVAEVLP